MLRAVAACFLIGLAFMAHATDHVLGIVNVHYSDPSANTLEKVIKGNIDYGPAIAKRLGFDTGAGDVKVLVDLKGQQIFAALEELNERTEPGDRVFVYYSGHGASTKYQNACVQAVVSSDTKLLLMRDFDRKLADIRTKARSMLVILDTCFSGGAVDEMTFRGGADKSAERFPMARMYVPLENCGVAINDRETAGPDVKQRGGGGGAALISAAADNEVSVGLGPNAIVENGGGLATWALWQCAERPRARTRNGDIDVAWLVQCAQDEAVTVWDMTGSTEPVQHLQRGGVAVVPMHE